ncbi:MAG: chromosome segregation SMC family protein, partial [Anaerolineales bacterium]
MPRLTRLELQGYKSFATKSEFLFGEGVTCIVGPNGSGKSNIADALRWVLGEQSFSALRGRKTEDMIFAGTENRARAGMAAVGVVFDNSDGWLPIDFSEVSIARRAYRDGQNEYLLNGQKTRLRDISDLLATVGLAQRTYTIMGQGLVDAALSLRAEERRSLFEEAAGIGAYRQKRSETLRRLDQTQRNLERAQDIVAEIGPRLRALERQARKTEQHAQIRTDLRALLKVWYGYHWHRLQTRVSEARAHANEQAVVLQTMQTERARAEEALTELRIRITAQRTQRDNQRDELARRQAEYEAVQREAAVSAERLRSLTERRESAREELAEFESRLAEARARDAAAEAEAASRAAERATAAARVRELEAQAAANEREREALTVLIRESQGRASSLAQQISELHARNEALQAEQARRLSEQEGLQSKIAAHATTLDDKQKACDIAHEAAVQAAAERAAIAAEITTVQAQLAALDLELAEAAQAVAAADAIVERQQARLEVLQQEHAALDGAASGRELLQSAVATGRLAGHRGQLIDILEIDPAHRAAIAAALGQALQTLIVDDYIAVDAARAVLAGRGRAVLAPLRAGRKFARPEFEAPPPDMIAFAADIVSCPPAYRDTIELLLGHTVVCRTSAAAHSIAAALPAGGVAVTLDGEAHHADGRVVIGASNESRTLALARELNILPARLDAASAAAAAARTRHEEIARRRAAGRAQIDALTDSHAAAQQAEHAANTARDEAQLALDRERAALEMAQTQLATAAARLREIAEQLDSAGRQATQLSQAHATAHQEAQMLIGQRADLTSPELAEQLAAERTALAV